MVCWTISRLDFQLQHLITEWYIMGVYILCIMDCVTICYNYNYLRVRVETGFLSFMGDEPAIGVQLPAGGTGNCFRLNQEMRPGLAA